MAYHENQRPQAILPAPSQTSNGFVRPSASVSVGVAGNKPAAPSQESTSRVSKVTRRRAVLACVSCRARKVRCDVVEGSPCGNCKWDNVPCIIVEGRRQVKRYLTVSKAVVDAEEKINGGAFPSRHTHIQPRPTMGTDESEDGSSVYGTNTDAPRESDVDDSTQSADPKPGRTHRHPRRDRTANLLGMLQVVASADPNVRQLLAGLNNTQTTPGAASSRLLSSSSPGTHRLPIPPRTDEGQGQLPAFIAPLPSRIDAEDIRYLTNKGALALPSLALQSALQQAYVEFVHPCLPLLDLSEFLSAVNPNSTSCNKPVSLLLYRAVLFAASTFVDIEYLRQEGFSCRLEARRAFFQRTRLLYDFDYEDDRLIAVQSLLLMTFWHERPEQKDTWHWTGVAISMAYTIGLHRSSSVTDMPVRQQRLWRRIWWSCVHRDRQVSLGMRRPIRIKDGTYDVPMLSESDFEIEMIPENETIVSSQCIFLRDLGMQYELATLCVSMARLCICIGNVFKTQLNEIEGDRQQNTRSSIEAVDEELTAWADSLRSNCRYQPPTASDIANGRGPIAVQRSFVHMLYHASVLCLHRPKSLPPLPSQLTTSNKQIQDVWHQRVHESAMKITEMASKLRELRLEKYLPLTGISVILPAMTIQLLEMKSPLPLARQRAAESFRQCMNALEGLKDTYAAADYATEILGGAFSQLNLDADSSEGSVAQQSPSTGEQADSPQIPPIENAPFMTSYEILFSAKFVRHHSTPQSTGNDSHNNNIEMASGSVDASLISGVYQVDRSWDFGGPHGGAELDADGMDPYGFEAVDLGVLRGHSDEMGWDSLTKDDVDMTQWLGLLPEDVSHLNRF